MSSNKRTRATFKNILSGTSTVTSSNLSVPSVPSDRQRKKRKMQSPLPTESRSISLIDIQMTLEKIVIQNSELNAKVDEVLERVAKIEEDRVIDQEFINVLNFLS
jgi:uncharacterized protein YdgA (DUF945 family)